MSDEVISRKQSIFGEGFLFVEYQTYLKIFSSLFDDFKAILIATFVDPTADCNFVGELPSQGQPTPGLAQDWAGRKNVWGIWGTFDGGSPLGAWTELNV